MSMIKRYYESIIDKAHEQTGIEWALLHDIFFEILIETDTGKAIKIFENIIQKQLYYKGGGKNEKI